MQTTIAICIVIKYSLRDVDTFAGGVRTGLMLLFREPNQHDELMSENFIPSFLVCSVDTQFLSSNMLSLTALHGHCE